MDISIKGLDALPIQGGYKVKFQISKCNVQNEELTAKAPRKKEFNRGGR